MSSATTFRHRATFVVGGVSTLFTTYWGDTSIVGSTALATEASARVRAFFNALAAVIKSTSTLTIDPTVIQINSGTGEATGAFTGSAPAAVTFTGSTDALPLSTQALIRLQTGVFVRGRALKGRIFLPGLMENANTDGVGPSGTVLTTLNTAVGLLGTTVVSSIDQLVWHRPNDALGVVGQSELVTARSISPNWAVQKGRRP